MNFFEKFFQEYQQCQTVWVQIRLDKMSGQNLGPNCLQKLAADNTKRQRVNPEILHSSSGIEVGVTHIILSGFILKSLFSIILTRNAEIGIENL